MRLFAPNYSDKMFDIYQNQFGMFPLGDTATDIAKTQGYVQMFLNQGFGIANAVAKAEQLEKAQTQAEIDKILGSSPLKDVTDNVIGKVALYGVGGIVVLVALGMLLGRGRRSK